MLPQRPVRGMDVVLVGLESGEPMVEVDLVLQLADGLLGDPAFEHMADHALGADLLGTAVGVTDDHDILHSKFVDRYEHRAHGLPEGVGHASAGVLDEDHVPVVQSEGGRKQVHQAGVHARYDRRLHPRVLRGGVLVVLLVLDEFAVVVEDPAYHRRSHSTPESRVSASRDQSASRRAGLNVPGPLQFLSAISPAMLNADIAAAMDPTEAPQAPA